VHAGALVGAVLVLHPLLGGVPVSVLCAVVAAELLRAGGWRETLKIVDHPSANRWRWLAAFLGVVVLDLPAAMALVLVIAAEWAYRRSRRDARRIVPSRPHRIH
jgi:MFS superfamily sulfate permease-like transporter